MGTNSKSKEERPAPFADGASLSVFGKLLLMAQVQETSPVQDRASRM